MHYDVTVTGAGGVLAEVSKGNLEGAKRTRDEFRTEFPDHEFIFVTRVGTKTRAGFQRLQDLTVHKGTTAMERRLKAVQEIEAKR